MAKYILLLAWTEQGVRAAKESPGRLDKARELGKTMGITIQHFYMVMGDHDLVAIVDASDDAVMAKFVLRLAGTGSLRTKTLKAFDEDQYREIMGAL